MWVKKKFIETINNALKLYTLDDYAAGDFGFEEFKSKKYLETVSLVNSFRNALDDRRMKMEKLEASYQDSLEKNERLTKVKESLENKLEIEQGELLRDNGRLKKRAESLEVSCRASLKENREILDENASLKAVKRRLEVENEDSSQKNRNLEELNQTFKKHNQELAESYANIRADVAKEFANLKLQQGELLSYNSDLEERLEKLLSSYHLSLREHQEARKDIERLGNSNRRLEDRNKKLSEQRNTLSELYDALRRQNKKLLESYESSRDLFAGSWIKLGELNERLLETTNAFRKLLEDGSGESKSSAKLHLESILEIERQIVRIKSFADETLAEAKGKLESVSLDATEVDLKGLLLELKDQMRDIFPEKELKLEIVAEETAPSRVVAEKFRLGWILKCLLLNACANAEKGMVRCRIFRYQSDAAELEQAIPRIGVEIYNTGKAAPASGYKVTLEASRGLYGIRSSQYDDTVLGLNLLRELAVVIGGKLHLRSVQGEGDAYLLVLPVSIEWRTRKPKVEEDESPLPGDKAFLVLEDDIRLVKYLSKVFKQNGYKWVVAYSAKEVLALVERYFIDALFVGSQWYNKEGEKLLSEVQNKLLPRRIPVCALSDTEIMNLEWKSRFMGYLPNPCQQEQLESIFKRVEAYSKVQPLNVLVLFNGDQPSPIVSDVLGKIDAQPVFMKPEKDLSLPHLFDLFLFDFTQEDVSTFDLFELVEKAGKLAGYSPIIVCLNKEPSYRKQTFLRQNADIHLFAGGTLSESCLSEAIFLANRRRDMSPDKRRKNFMDYVSARDGILQDRQCLMISDSVINSEAIKFRKQLTSLGMTIGVNAQGKNLLEILNENRFLDLIVIYRLQSKTNIRNWLGTIRNNETSKYAPVLIVDNESVYGDRQFWINDGADEFLVGFSDPRQLASTVRGLIGAGFLDLGH